MPKLTNVYFQLKTMILVFVVTIATVSCSQNETLNDSKESNAKDLDLQNLRLNLGDLDFKTDSIILFQVNNESDLNREMNTTFKEFIEELDEIVASDRGVDHYTFDLNFDQGRALITNIYFFNTENQKFVDVFETGNAPSCVACALEAIFMGSCPDGWTNAGSCSSAACISATLAQYMTPALSASGGCIMTHTSRGLVSVRICIKSC